MRYKTCPAFKVSPDGANSDGDFEAIVSVFNNVDAYSDVVLPGAFADTLAEWKASGDPIPVLWSHRMDDPRFAIGTVVEAAELEPHDRRIPDWADQWVKDNGGLWTHGRIDTGADATDVAVAARKLLLARRVKQFSYAYDVIDGGWGTVNGEDAYELRKVRLYEVSPTHIGANDLTQLIGAKGLTDVDREVLTVIAATVADREPKPAPKDAHAASNLLARLRIDEQEFALDA